MGPTTAWRHSLRVRLILLSLLSVVAVALVLSLVSIVPAQRDARLERSEQSSIAVDAAVSELEVELDRLRDAGTGWPGPATVGPLLRSLAVEHGFTHAALYDADGARLGSSWTSPGSAPEGLGADPHPATMGGDLESGVGPLWWRSLRATERSGADGAAWAVLVGADEGQSWDARPWTVMGATVLLAAVLATLVFSKTMAPLPALVRGMAEVERGALGFRIVLRTRDELRELGDSFNTMSESLRHHQEGIEAQHLLLERRVAERSADLARATAELRSLSASRDRLLVAIADDLAQPAEVLFQHGRALRDEDARDPRRGERLLALTAAAQRVNVAVDQGFELATRNSTTAFRLEDCNLREQLEQACESVAEDLRAAGVQLRLQGVPKDARGKASRVAVVRVLTLGLLWLGSRCSPGEEVEIALQTLPEGWMLSGRRLRPDGDAAGSKAPHRARLARPDQWRELALSTTREMGGELELNELGLRLVMIPGGSASDEAPEPPT